MIVVSMTDCPPRLRGDLSKWLMEINSGVYVGQVSARVREELWNRICENLKTGRATMVYSTNGEQHMSFLVHNTTWEPVDFDGITLIRRPINSSKNEKDDDTVQTAYESNASKMLKAQRINAARQKIPDDYVVLNLITTGVNANTDNIIEIGAVLILQGEIEKELRFTVKQKLKIPKEISAMTGITNDDMLNDGVVLESGIRKLKDFIGKYPLVTCNASVNSSFLRKACKQAGITSFTNRMVDVLVFARKKKRGIKAYKLEDISIELGINTKQVHRVLEDCKLTYQVFEKLKEIE